MRCHRSDLCSVCGLCARCCVGHAQMRIAPSFEVGSFWGEKQRRELAAGARVSQAPRCPMVLSDSGAPVARLP